MLKPSFTFLTTAVLATGVCVAQEPPADEEDLQVVVTGTRVANRSALDTSVPVDVVSGDTLSNAGLTELSQALSTALPSFNFPRPGLADGTDTIRPATLRGLGPDQTLVLLNSKRRHPASLVNLNQTIGRGATAVDLNTIPTAIVQSVEVLRDGASAQYGSDAIAGVINVRLKEARDGGDVGLTFGQYDTTFESPRGLIPGTANWSAPETIERDRSDGDTMTVSAWKGLGFGESGFVTLAAEYKDQEHTERDGYDFRAQYAPDAGPFVDPRDASADRFNAWYGEPELDQLSFFANAGSELEGGAKLYGWASYQDRDSRSAGFFRRPNDARNVVEIYPDGFLPIIAPEVTDFSAAGGMTWNIGEWQIDSSLVYGRNKMEFTIENTLNRSLGPASPTEFDAGGFEYDQLALNFSGVRQFEVGRLASPLNVATGIEARQESYEIFAGEPDSYRNGGVLLNNQPTASGAQVFPGFRPANEVDEDRTAIGAYLDLEANVTEQFLASAAIRAESYSDFGENVSGKLAGRYDFTEAFAIRGSVQNGFRAPSLPQQFFATTSTNFINGVPFDITTFPVSDPIARALGATDLDAEESTNFSIGAVWQLERLTVTVDAYRIDIDDRIVLSENLTQAEVRTFLINQGFIGAGGGRFFINGVDTETQGVDLVVSWPLVTEGAGRFDFTLTGNYNETDVTRVPTTAPLATISPSPPLFDRINILTFEKGTPKDKIGAAVNWRLGGMGATLRATRYGEILDPGTSAALDATLSPKTVADLELRFELLERFRFALGAENLFDEYPDPLPIGISNATNRNATGNTPYSNYAPFGRGGRFIYGRISVGF